VNQLGYFPRPTDLSEMYGVVFRCPEEKKTEEKKASIPRFVRVVELGYSH
jgi:hypothetical protein